MGGSGTKSSLHKAGDLRRFTYSATGNCFFCVVVVTFVESASVVRSRVNDIRHDNRRSKSLDANAVFMAGRAIAEWDDLLQTMFINNKRGKHQ